MPTFRRTALDEGLCRVALDTGHRLFEHTPAGVTVVEVLGMQAIAATGYPESASVSRAHIAMRSAAGILQVVTHRLQPLARADCAGGGCASVTFESAITKVDRYGNEGDPIGPIDYLKAINTAHDALGLLLRSGTTPEHNPFVDPRSYTDLQILAEYHTKDPMLAAIAARLPQ